MPKAKATSSINDLVMTNDFETQLEAVYLGLDPLGRFECDTVALGFKSGLAEAVRQSLRLLSRSEQQQLLDILRRCGGEGDSSKRPTLVTWWQNPTKAEDAPYDSVAISAALNGWVTGGGKTTVAGELFESVWVGKGPATNEDMASWLAKLTSRQVAWQNLTKVREEAKKKERDVPKLIDEGLLLPKHPLRDLIDISSIRAQLKLTLSQSGMSYRMVGEKMGYPPESAAQSVNSLVADYKNPGVLTLDRFAFATEMTLAEILALPIGKPSNCSMKKEASSESPRELLDIGTIRSLMRAARDQSGLNLGDISVLMGYKKANSLGGLLLRSDNPGILTLDRFAAATGLTLVEFISMALPAPASKKI